MRLVIALCFLATGAFAFAPSRPAPQFRANGVRAAALDNMVGVSVETGNKPWDPLGFGSVSSTISGEHSSVMPDIKWLREAEIKHCRICMLAFVGTIAASLGVVFPGDLGGFHYEPCAWYDGFSSAFSTNPLGMGQLLLAIGIVEGHFFPGDFWTGGGDREAGDLGFLPFGTADKFKKDAKDLQLSELKNGRLAMIAMAAFFAQHQIPGSVPFLPDTI